MLQLKETIFTSEDFKAFSRDAQADAVWNYERMDELSQPALYALGTILLKSQCECQFRELVTDEMTGEQFILQRKKHARTCITVRYPVLEDYSVRQLQRRQRVEIPFDHQHLLMIEENSAGPRKVEKTCG